MAPPGNAKDCRKAGAQRWGITSKWGRPRNRARAGAHADKKDRGPRCEAEEAPGHGITASGAVPVRGGRQRARLRSHDYRPRRTRGATSAADCSEPHAAAGKGVELVRGSASSARRYGARRGPGCTALPAPVAAGLGRAGLGCALCLPTPPAAVGSGEARSQPRG